MTYITGNFHARDGYGNADRLPDARRAHAASQARYILGDDADVYDIVTLAEFLVGDGAAQPALATAPPTPAPVANAEGTPFVFHARDAEGVSVSVHGHDNDNDGDDYAVTAMVTNGTVAGLTYYEARALRDKLTGLLG